MFYDPHAPLPRTASYASQPPRTASYASYMSQPPRTASYASYAPQPLRTASYGAPHYTSSHAYEPNYTSGHAYEPHAYEPRAYEHASARDYEPRMPRTASHVPPTRSYADRYLASTAAYAAGEQQRVMGTSARSFYESQLA
jgi:hypothetical protein